MEANVDRRQNWQKGLTIQFVDVRGEPTVKLACTCRRALSEDFDNGRLVCPRCGNEVSIDEAGEALSRFVGKAEELLDALADAMKARGEKEATATDEPSPAKSSRAKSKQSSDG